MHFLLALLLAWTSLPAAVYGMKNYFEIDTRSKVFELADFCFDQLEIGTLSVHVTRHRDSKHLPALHCSTDENAVCLTFIDDRNWDGARKYLSGKQTSQKCMDLRAYADRHTNGLGNRELLAEYGGGAKVLTEAFIDKSNEHLWHVLFTRCSGENTNIDLEMHFLNQGGWWYSEFSCDQQGMLPMFLTYWLLYTLVALFVTATLIVHCVRRASTLAQRLYCAVMWMMAVGFFSVFVDYAVFADDGYGAPGMRGLGQVLLLAADLFFMVIMLLFAIGIGAGRRAFEPPPAADGAASAPRPSEKAAAVTRVLLVAFVVFFNITYAAFFIWLNVGSDDVEMAYGYDTAPGIILLILRVVLGGVLIAFALVTMFKDRDVGRQIIVAVALFVSCAWLLLLVLYAIIGAGVDPMWRLKVIGGLWMGTSFLLQLLVAVVLGVGLGPVAPAIGMIRSRVRKAPTEATPLHEDL